ncbi:plasmid mobilization relaxosome protein MobC, partial [Turicibacter sanguinis]|nr:plasmid mobilization relaxosome protein MobC [Turicibacter sanguinis]
MKNRTRPKQMMFRVTEKEKEMILNNSEKLGFKKFENYARKML